MTVVWCDNEARQKKSNTLRDLEEVKPLTLYNLNVGNKEEGLMEDDVQISSLGNWMENGAHHEEGTDLMGKLLPLSLVC